MKNYFFQINLSSYVCQKVTHSREYQSSDEELGLQARLAPAGGSIALLGHTAQLIICQGFVPTTGLSLVLECRSSDYTGSSGPGVWEPVAHSLWSWHMLSGPSEPPLPPRAPFLRS